MPSSELRERVFTLLYSKRRPEDAILQLNRIIKEKPDNQEALALKAYALNRLANERKDWKFSESALECAGRALALNPDDDLALTSKGWALIDLGRAREALDELMRATTANPNNEYAWFNLAWSQYLSGDAVGSTESMARALRISPGNAIIKHGKEMMEKGQIPAHLKKKAGSAN